MNFTDDLTDDLTNQLDKLEFILIFLVQHCLNITH